MLLSGNAYFRWKDHVPDGMPNARKGLLAPGDGPNFPRIMKGAGYLTYHHGKRGNTAPLIQAQFEVNKYLKDDMAERRSGEPGKEIVDEAIAFLAAKRDPRPVFMYLAFGNPHDPRVAARRTSIRARTTAMTAMSSRVRRAAGNGREASSRSRSTTRRAVRPKSVRQPRPSNH